VNSDYSRVQDAARGTRSPRWISHADTSGHSPRQGITSLENSFSYGRAVRQLSANATSLAARSDQLGIEDLDEFHTIDSTWDT